ncbi:MAG: hypothetical protein IJ165_11770 [Proteobacteria bacterium]|nr:hypothetical protein [Pseudomonadota bacterium]
MLHQFLGTNTANAQSLDPYSAIEDGLVQRKQFNSHEEAEKLHKPEYAKALAFARKHITPSPDSDEFYRAAPKVEVIQKLSEIYDALPGLEKKKALKIQFAPSSGAFDENGFEKQCQMLYPDEDFSDAAGVFFPSSDDAKSHTVILRSNITSEAMCHEIGHVIHESNDPAAYGPVERGVDYKRIQAAIEYSIQASKGKRFDATALNEEPTAIQTMVKNIDTLIQSIKNGDSGNKELMANIIGIYLSGNIRTKEYIERKYSISFSGKNEYNLIDIALDYVRGSGYSITST